MYAKAISQSDSQIQDTPGPEPATSHLSSNSLYHSATIDTQSALMLLRHTWDHDVLKNLDKVTGSKTGTHKFRICIILFKFKKYVIIALKSTASIYARNHSRIFQPCTVRLKAVHPCWQLKWWLCASSVVYSLPVLTDNAFCFAEPSEMACKETSDACIMAFDHQYVGYTGGNLEMLLTFVWDRPSLTAF